LAHSRSVAARFRAARAAGREGWNLYQRPGHYDRGV